MVPGQGEEGRTKCSTFIMVILGFLLLLTLFSGSGAVDNGMTFENSERRSKFNYQLLFSPTIISEVYMSSCKCNRIEGN